MSLKSFKDEKFSFLIINHALEALNFLNWNAKNTF